MTLVRAQRTRECWVTLTKKHMCCMDTQCKRRRLLMREEMHHEKNDFQLKKNSVGIASHAGVAHYWGLCTLDKIKTMLPSLDTPAHLCHILANEILHLSLGQRPQRTSKCKYGVQNVNYKAIKGIIISRSMVTVMSWVDERWYTQKVFGSGTQLRCVVVVVLLFIVIPPSRQRCPLTGRRLRRGDERRQNDWRGEGREKRKKEKEQAQKLEERCLGCYLVETMDQGFAYFM